MVNFDKVRSGITAKSTIKIFKKHDMMEVANSTPVAETFLELGILL